MNNKYGLPNSSLFYQRELLLPNFEANVTWAKVEKCPFKDNCKPNCFSVNLNSGGFNCSSCKAKGKNIISFYMKLYDVDFRLALESIKNEWRSI